MDDFFDVSIHVSAQAEDLTLQPVIEAEDEPEHFALPSWVSLSFNRS